MSATLHAPAETFFSDSSDRQLFCAYHPATTYAQREHGVLICYPFGQEYIRSHRACHQLGVRLAQAGYPVLRFDYRGTGDSTGEASESGLDDWQADVQHALQLLQDRSGVETLCLVGLRLGASLAYRVAAEAPDVGALVLWEPVVNGGNYLDELSDAHRELLWRFFDNASRFDNDAGTEYLGFPLSSGLRSDLDNLNLRGESVPNVRRIAVLESKPQPEVALLCDRLRSADRDIDHLIVPCFPVWREDVDKGLVPDPVLKGIVSWVEDTLE